MINKYLTATAAAAFLFAAPALAQNTKVDAGGGKGLVVVDVSALDQSQIDVLRDANIEVLNDNTVQVPINVAATLCDIEVNAIASSNERGSKSCAATSAGFANFQG
jgi:hypothetical protein